MLACFLFCHASRAFVRYFAVRRARLAAPGTLPAFQSWQQVFQKSADVAPIFERLHKGLTRPKMSNQMEAGWGLGIPLVSGGRGSPLPGWVGKGTGIGTRHWG